MSPHANLPIHRACHDLCALATRTFDQMSRSARYAVGQDLVRECFRMVMLVEAANEARGEARAAQLAQLSRRLQTVKLAYSVGHQQRMVTQALWAQSMQLTGSIGRQIGGWIKAPEDGRKRTPVASRSRP